MGLFDKLLGGLGPAGEAKKRVEELQKRLRANPTNVRIAIELADAMKESGSGKQAIRQLNELGPVLQKKGQFLAAMAVYKKVSEMDPVGLDPATATSLKELKKLQEAQEARLLPDTAPRSSTSTGITPAEAAEAQLRREQVHPLLTKIPLFKDVPPHLIDQLITKIHVRSYGAGETIFQEGAPGSSLFFVVEGEVSVHGKDENSREIVLATLSEGAVAGEISFLSALPRSATLKTKTPALCLELERRAVDPLLSKSPKLREALTNLYKERVLNDVLVRSKIFGTLPKGAREVIAERLTALNVPAGDTVPSSSTPPEALFLLSQGLIRVTLEEGGREVEKAILSPPAFFGNLSIISIPEPGQTPIATALTDVELFVFRPDDLRPLLDAQPHLWATLDEVQLHKLGKKPA